MKTTTAFAFLSLALTSATYADNFGSGPDTFDIEFVTIGNPGNAADTTSGDPSPVGKVDYTYRIGKFEISEDMIDKANTLGGLGLTHDNRGPNKPATSISWFGAAKFVNWLNTSTGSTPAYKFVGGSFQLWEPGDPGYNSANLYRNSLAEYFLPSIDEWYKSAHYDPTNNVYYIYPTGSDTAPVHVASGTDVNTAVYRQSFFSQDPADITIAGGLSPYGTMGQGGNVWEREETDVDLVNNSTSSARGVRGGYWASSRVHLANVGPGITTSLPSNEGITVGFRVASVIPEPTTCTLALATLCLAMSRRRAL